MPTLPVLLLKSLRRIVLNCQVSFTEEFNPKVMYLNNLAVVLTGIECRTPFLASSNIFLLKNRLS